MKMISKATGEEKMPSEYYLNTESHKVFFRPERLIATIQEDIYNSPWFGHKEQVEPGLNAVVNDAFALFGNEREVCYCTLFSLINPEYKKLSSYFFPFILTSSEPADPPVDQIYVVLKCIDKDLYLYEAEHNKKFLVTLLDNIVDEEVLNTEKKAKILFKKEKDFNIQGTIRSFQIGRGKTGNILYRIRMDNQAFILKSYRQISSQFEEVQTLEMLDKAGFGHSPSVYAHYCLGTEQKFKTLGLLIGLVQGEGTLENQILDSFEDGSGDGVLPRLEDLGGLIKEMHEALTQTREDISEDDVELYREFYQTRLDRAFGFMETRMVEVRKEPVEDEENADGEEGEEPLDSAGAEGDDAVAEEENAEAEGENAGDADDGPEDPAGAGPSEEKAEVAQDNGAGAEDADDKAGKEAPGEAEIESTIIMESTYVEDADDEEDAPDEDEEVELVPVPGPLADYKEEAEPLRPLLDKISKDYAKLASKQKQRLHQHLEMSQVVVSGDELFIMDFKGDPTRQGAQRVRPLPVEHDIASLFYSLKVLGQDQGDWPQKAQDAFVKGYGKKDVDMDLVNLFLIQRAVSDIAFFRSFPEERTRFALDLLKELTA